MMDVDVKDDPAKATQAPCPGKAGWLKKSSGKFLGSYKDRYIQLEKTEIAVYENEDLKNCVERLDLENYEKCLELRSPFKKKYRLVLIRAPKSGSKVCDIKLQASNQEEKEIWIKALSDGINKAKNKVFDEVKVDESLSLEHVTRSRPKGNRGRRPPTRIHMKETANISSDGVLILDLEDSKPNGTHFLSVDGSAQAPPSKSFDAIPEEDMDEDSAAPKKVLKPPMPPSKENKPSENQEGEAGPEEAAPQKKILMPPMPPSKEQKPPQNVQEEPSGSEMEEKKVVKPPMPPSKENKPRISSTGDTTEDSSSSENEESEAGSTRDTPSQEQEKIEDTESSKSGPIMKTHHPPTPPLKDVKPKPHHQGVNNKGSMEVVETAEESDMTKTKDVPKQQGVMWDSPSGLQKSSADHSEAVQKSPGRPAPPKKKPVKVPVKTEDQTEGVPESVEPKEEQKIIILSPNSSEISEETNNKSAVELDEKSIDSGQISAEESESSDQVTPSTDKLQSSLEVLDGVTSEEELEPSDSKKDPPSSSPVTAAGTALKSSKLKSASMGDLLNCLLAPESAEGQNMEDLQTKVSMEIKKTEELLDKITPREPSEGPGDTDGVPDPEVLLTAAMEKLRKAEQFLREAKSLKEQENKSNRTSW
ncbi:pleckstrin homology domain-containing family O member 2 [Trichomycterus rosablanca]|uniref:pleckstrin homology domain-containing family O member 2 n=1 Tax=Trichomycterus rosablanca TaxID=2290929 RepID=UPI002F35DEA9